MADPISIIGLVDLAFGKCLQLYNFFSSVADAGEEIKHFVLQLEDFKKIFPFTRSYAEQLASSPPSAGGAIAQEVLLPMLRACVVDFQAIYDTVEGHNPKNLSAIRRLGKNVSWVLDQAQIQELSRRLDAAKLNLSLALQISGRQNDVSIEQQVGQIMDTQDKLYAELRQALQLFTPFLQRSIEQQFGRYQNSNMESEVRLEDLSESMLSDFPSIFNMPNTAPRIPLEEREMVGDPDDTEAQNMPEVPNTPATNDPGSDANPRLLRSITINESDPEVAEALKRFKELSTDKSGPSLGNTSSAFSSTITDVLKEVEQAKWKFSKGSNIGSKFTNQIRSGMDVWTKFLPPESTAALWGSYGILLQASKTSTNTLNSMIEGLAETSDVIRICQREYDLYPAPEIRNAMTKLYVAVLEFAREAQTVMLRSSSRRVLDSLSAQDPAITKLLTKIQKQTQAIMQEVEYQQRLEMRDMSLRVRNIERDQQKILTGIKNQKKILESLQEQQKIMSMIKTQQEILQGVQQLLFRIGG